MDIRIHELPDAEEMHQLDYTAARLMLTTLVVEWRASTTFDKLSLEPLLKAYESHLALLSGARQKAYREWMSLEDAAIRNRMEKRYNC